MNKQNFIAYTEQEILNDAKILARKLDNNSQFYDPNYNQQLYQQDLDYLNKDKYNIEYLRKNFRLGR